jgi:septal ring factor EnvC (AmiA/AmiB activator)
MALGDKVDELQRHVATLIAQMGQVLKSLDGVFDAQRGTEQDLAALKREFEREIALLRREIDDVKKWKEDLKKDRDERSRRLWAFGPSIVAALISGAIAAVVAYFVSRR